MDPRRPPHLDLLTDGRSILSETLCRMDHFDELWPENAKNDQIPKYRLSVDVRNLVWWGSCHGISVSMNSSPNFEIAPKRHFVKMLRTASDERLRDPDLAVTLIHSAMH